MMPTIRIDSDVWAYLQSKAKPFEDSPNDVLRRELGLESPTANEISGDPSPVSSATYSRGRDANLILPDTDYTHQRVTAYMLDGKHFPAHTFKDILMGVSNHLRHKHLGSFDKVALGLRGKKRVYFSLDPKDLRFPARVPDSNLFVETNLNANLIAAVCSTLVKALGHDVAEFEIRCF